MRILCGSVVCAVLIIGLGCEPKTVTIVQEGKPTAKIVIAHNASADLKTAAQTLARYIEAASGAKLEILSDESPQARQGITIQVGKTRLCTDEPIFPDGLDDDGFVLRAGQTGILIAGPTDWGTEFGVYDFLERVVGVRWLLPGSDGEDVPVRKTIAVPEGIIIDQPVFFSRLFSGLRGAAQVQWARFNRMHGRVSFHHNLLHLIPPAKYTKTHPEFFPMKDGKTRYLPTPTEHGWQPCFTAPGLVEEAVRNIIAYFKEHPEATSYSLGANDSSGYCRCPNCMSRITGEKNFLGHTDFSDLYYDWCNQVIEGVLKVYPDKWFGCLAYSEVAAPPKRVKVHPRLIPYMTYDRMKWIHPQIESKGHNATKAWHATSPTIGWYDYIYGTPYCLPRVYFHKSGEYLRFAQRHGVKAHYAELYPNFGEGPKPYIFLKLWWNPNQNVDALLKEWYERCVGPDAAPALAAYYAIWERFWTKDILKSRWFTVGGQYLRFDSPAYLADVKKEDIAQSRKFLDECIARCRTEKQRARARLLEMAFQYYEASALAYLADQQLRGARVDTEEQALSVLEQSVTALEMAQKRRTLALAVFPKDPVLVHPLGVDRSPVLAGKTWGGNGIWAVADWVMKENSRVRQRVEELAAKSTSPVVRDQAAIMLSVIKGKASMESRNSSFEEGEGQAAANWWYWLKPDVPPEKPVGRMLRTDEIAHSGKFSLLCDGMRRGGPVQQIDFKQPGRYCALAWLYAPPTHECKGTVELSVTPLDEKGSNLPGFSTTVTPTPGKWIPLAVGFDLNGQIEEKKVHALRLIPIVNGFEPDGKVYLDDVALYRVGPIER